MYGKRLKSVGNDLEIWEISKIFGKWLKYMGNGLKNLRNGISMLQMT